jgi:hypothetical protein
MSLQEQLINAALSVLSEGKDSSKEMIANNVVASFDEMGMAKANPGEFSPEEITDKANLTNTAEMSNDTDFEGKVDGQNDMASGIIDVMNNLTNDMVDISVGSEQCDHCHPENEEKELHILEFGESYLGKYIDKLLGGKTCEEYLQALNESGEKEKKYTYKRSASGEYEIRGEDGKIASVCNTEEEAEEWIKEHNKFLVESNYAGPLDFVPDLRINASDVITTLKREIGEGSEGIHVDQVYDKQHNNAYKVSQIDEKLLPKKIQVEKVLLELGDDNIYYVNKPSDTYPMAK